MSIWFVIHPTSDRLVQSTNMSSQFISIEGYAFKTLCFLKCISVEGQIRF